MKLEITEDAKQMIEKKLAEGDKIFLDYENGDSIFSSKGYSCGLDFVFKLILLGKESTGYDTSSYDIPLETSLGTVWINKSAEHYLDKNIKFSFDKSYYSLRLSGDSGLITGDVTIERK
ncbi:MULTISPECIES: iron-sulfur cluster biosynthesis family protein [unclassified Enterococcus]|jgi:uncharacterized protein YqkB|uniref:iron-sulfur cluster biosynthesis family protein n=1 Tax=unclassified Enterococcus TaxID=2608891 RepID=UPI0003530F56|nr:hypothetical protein D920_02351 [Enterococcus faecalis 13-SD-W-01]